MKRKVLIIDPSLRSADGHHLGVLHRFQTELAKLHLGSVSLVSLHASDDLRREATLVPTFEKSIYYRTQWTPAEFDDGARTFCADLRRAMREVRIRPDIMIFPAADQVTLSGLARYLARHRRRNPPEVLLWLMMAPHYKKSIDDPSTASLMVEYQEAFDALRRAVANDARIHVCCETSAMAAAYAPHVGLKIETVIVHKLIERPRERRVRGPGDPIKVVCTGNANAAKGYSLLADAIDGLNRARDDLEFLIHGTVEQTDYPEGRQVLQRLAGLAPNVTVRTDVLSTEDYLAWLSRADLLLQPYDPLVYRTRGSGVFAEAMKLGIPVVATNGCDFSRAAIEQGRAVGMEDFSAESLVRAVLTAADGLEEISVRAASFAASLGVDRSLEMLLARTAAAAKTRQGWFDKALKQWPWSAATQHDRVA
ncbi:glycosyltransferase [Reyranella sp.]|uniref:glycosyltransferase n=1 Tax=Reyranella sp. TaxID=1929291 RepID=UPI002F956B1F